MKKAILLLSLLATSLTLSNTALAQRSVEEVFTQCGIGAAIFGETSPSLASISNVSWDLGTTAATSDLTDSCSIDSSEVAAAIFIHESYAQLESDISKGQGKYFDGLTSILECDGSSATQLRSDIRSEMATIVQSSTYTDMSATAKSYALYEIVAPKIAETSADSCSVS